MVTYSPWEQPADFDRLGAQVLGTHFESNGSAVTSGTDELPTDASDSDWIDIAADGMTHANSLIRLARESAVTTGPGPGNLGYVQSVAHRGRSLGVEAAGNPYGYPVGRYNADSKASESVEYAPALTLPPVDWSQAPPGAAGYQWERPICTPIAAHADWELTPEVVTTHGARYTFRLEYADGLLLGGYLDMLDDITVYDDGPVLTDLGTNGRVRFSARIADHYLTVPDSYPGSMTEGVAVYITLNVAYTLRPPRLRWAFDAQTPAPPCRLFPRDDGLGTSSAARIYPPPKSQQRSNRHVGYY